ncbi:hypothetical protein [Paraburkholderia sp. BL17N1]|uniref:hypothetical protein n=1 Tax=Paraburkholderia sp. BL17N1 TaxID=1938798 RepID=UPI000F26B267|nr:hypothetical protein [Paraburkholderia sp. BL17N1]RKR43213.1 hypothetical protein B0G82_0766 [Paraburkholderia sp. BL17N1]
MNQVDAGPPVKVSKVYVPPVRRGADTDDAATQSLVAAFKGAGFSAVSFADPKAPPANTDPAIYVWATSGSDGDDECLQAFVEVKRLPQDPNEIHFEWHQVAKVPGFSPYTRDGCSAAFVKGLKGELAKRKL